MRKASISVFSSIVCSYELAGNAFRVVYLTLDCVAERGGLNQLLIVLLYAQVYLVADYDVRVHH